MKKIGVTLSLFASLKETREIKWCNDKIGRVTDGHLSKWRGRNGCGTSDITLTSADLWHVCS